MLALKYMFYHYNISLKCNFKIKENIFFLDKFSETKTKLKKKTVKVLLPYAIIPTILEMTNKSLQEKEGNFL